MGTKLNLFLKCVQKCKIYCYNLYEKINNISLCAVARIRTVQNVKQQLQLSVCLFYWSKSLAVFNSWCLMLGGSQRANLACMREVRISSHGWVISWIQSKHWLITIQFLRQFLPMWLFWTPSHARWTSILSCSELLELGKKFTLRRSRLRWSMLIYFSDLICIISPSADIFTF